MTDLTLVRHAQSTWNAEGRWQGMADPPLSAWGEEQARAAGRALRAAPDVLAASDLRRAAHTAVLLVAGREPAPELVVDPGLREYDAGAWTGLRRTEIAARWPGALEAWDAGDLERPPDGEDHESFLARLLDALGRLARQAPAGTVLAVSHGRAIHVVAAALGAEGGHVDHLAGWRLRLDPLPVVVGPVRLLPASPPA